MRPIHAAVAVVTIFIAAPSHAQWQQVPVFAYAVSAHRCTAQGNYADVELNSYSQWYNRGAGFQRFSCPIDRDVDLPRPADVQQIDVYVNDQASNGNPKARICIREPTRAPTCGQYAVGGGYTGYQVISPRPPSGSFSDFAIAWLEVSLPGYGPRTSRLDSYLVYR